MQIQNSYYERHLPGRDPDVITYSTTEVNNLLADKVTTGGLFLVLEGNGSTIPGYAKKTDLNAYALAAGNVDTTTDNYLRRTQSRDAGPFLRGYPYPAPRNDRFCSNLGPFRRIGGSPT